MYVAGIVEYAKGVAASIKKEEEEREKARAEAEKQFDAANKVKSDAPGKREVETQKAAISREVRRGKQDFGNKAKKSYKGNSKETVR